MCKGIFAGSKKFLGGKKVSFFIIGVLGIIIDKPSYSN